MLNAPGVAVGLAQHARRMNRHENGAAVADQRLSTPVAMRTGRPSRLRAAVAPNATMVRGPTAAILIEPGAASV